MRYLVMVGRHFKNIRDIARQSSITAIKGFLEMVFSVGSAPRLHSEDPWPAECSSVVNISAE
jgi:hypothetical protein